MSEVKWIKVVTDMFDSDTKIKQIELMPKGDTIVVIWFKLMMLAGKTNAGGAIYITPDVPFTDKALAGELRRPLPVVQKALSIFEQFGMIEREKGFIYLPAWEKHQNTDKLAELREKDRERKRVKRAQEKGVLSEGVRGQSEDSPSIEEEREEEGETHSFILSEASEADWDKPVENSAYSSTNDNSIDERDKRKRLRGILGGGLVMLSESEMDDLLDKLSIDEFDKYVDIVKQCEYEGKSFKKKTHYQAILDMALADRKKGRS